MKFARYAAIAAIIALPLGGCALLGNGTAADDALKAAQITLTTYADVYQPGVIAYGNLPACPVGAPVCHDPAALHALKMLDAQVTAALTSAQCVLEQTCSDTGQLAALETVIQSAETQIAKSGALTQKGS